MATFTSQIESAFLMANIYIRLVFTFIKTIVFTLITLEILFVVNVFAQKNGKLILAKQPPPNLYIVVLNDENGIINNFLNNPIGDEKVRKATRELTLFYGGQVDKQLLW